ncbi:MAG: sulfatase [Verrucomicrobiales bacterium]|nr:sulfatase [Verrucomicrobiales bacterium]|tara:strand:- start:14741 stop:16033 length:1293 start_codon:yes stop_codon:yes gene_type:complete
MAKQPNILLMISHDLGTYVGPYGCVPTATPALNGFAKEGMVFEKHFVSSPGCSQSRSSLITGRFPHSNGQFGLSHLGWTLNRDEQLLPDTLRAAGYHTAMFGIWHLHEWTLGGFNDLSDDVSTVDSSPEGFANIASKRAGDWLRNYQDEEPFYLHVGFWEAHRPFCGQPGDPSETPDVDLTDVSLPNYLPDNKATRREFAHLKHSVESVDAGVDTLLKALSESGHAEDTIVIFTADHGLPFPRAKGTLYDPGIQVAFIVRYPGQVREYKRCSALTSNVDVMPTLVELAGAEPPPKVQGKSLATLLRGESDTHATSLFAEKTYHEHYDPIRAIRTERYKFIRNFAERPNLLMPSDIYNSSTRQSMGTDEAFWSHRPEFELYDLEADPSETNNMAMTESELANDWSAKLEAWMKETGDPLLRNAIPRPTDQV